jgi:hypothetical protein
MGGGIRNAGVRLLGGWVLGWCSLAAQAGMEPTDAFMPPISPGAEPAGQLAQRILAAADHQGRPFAIVDKAAARIAVYFADGRLAGTTAVLLGLTPGDRSTSDVGLRTQTGRLRAEDRTTPAGRFDAEPGHNRAGEAIVWVDYDKAFAIHRLRPGQPQERRAERLASATTADNRISAGCVVVPVAFYESVIQPVLGKARSVVYVMPEESSVLTVAGTP